MWNPNEFNSASFVGGIVAMLVFAFIVWAAWRVSIGPMIETHRRRKIAEHEFRIEQLRREIRAEVEAALGTGDQDEELDPDAFQDDDSEDLPDGSTRHPA